jgi:enamine deaminase RidA (YjgF/YER057c/UK114 family)
MKRLITPASIATPASSYNHAVLVRNPESTLYMAGQLGERPDGTISDDFAKQARQIWVNIKTILSEAEMDVGDLVKIVSYLVGERHIRPYVAVHREAVGQHMPPWTLVVVAGLGSPKYLVEVEAVAAR